MCAYISIIYTYTQNINCIGICSCIVMDIAFLFIMSIIDESLDVGIIIQTTRIYITLATIPHRMIPTTVPPHLVPSNRYTY